ncbi:MAG: prepilin peptidase [Acidobacteriaceae bacterium]|nr:prepilin peptidase [Acidobacteriaceae bacterium]
MLLLLLTAVFGLLIGSFLNVCIYRIPRDISVVAPRSFCPECGSPVPWFDNIPVLSFALLRGKCRACAKPIGIRYPAVELTTAALFVWTVALYGLTVSSAKWLLFESILIVLFVTDLEERLLPDELTLGGSAVGLIFAFFVPVPGFPGDLLVEFGVTARSLLNAVAGASLLAAVLWLVGFLYARIRHRDGLGLGDVKLLILLGVYLGFERALLALLVGCVAGSIIGLGYILLTRKQASTYQLPLGSFLCAGAALIPLITRS